MALDPDTGQLSPCMGCKAFSVSRCFCTDNELHAEITRLKEEKELAERRLGVLDDLTRWWFFNEPGNTPYMQSLRTYGTRHYSATALADALIGEEDKVK